MIHKLPAQKSWPERRVVRVGVSPMNPKVKWAELDCGHDVYRQRKPRIGAIIVCERCSAQIDGRPEGTGQEQA